MWEQECGSRSVGAGVRSRSVGGGVWEQESGTGVWEQESGAGARSRMLRLWVVSGRVTHQSPEDSSTSSSAGGQEIRQEQDKSDVRTWGSQGMSGDVRGSQGMSGDVRK